MEHRWGDRIRRGVVVKLLAHRASIGCGQLRDISLTGGFIETKLPLQPLSTLLLTPTLSSRLGCQAAEIGAIVVRRTAEGVGVEWFDSDTDSVVILIREARAAFPQSQPPAGSRKTHSSEARHA